MRRRTGPVLWAAALAAAALAATACGGSPGASRTTTSRASQAARSTTTATIGLTDLEIADVVLRFGVDLQGVDVVLSLGESQRGPNALRSACKAVVDDSVDLAVAITGIRNSRARAIGTYLLTSARSAIDACTASPDAINSAVAAQMHFDLESYQTLSQQYLDVFGAQR